MVIVSYRILVAGEDEMEVYAHYKTEADAISSAKRLKKERLKVYDFVALLLYRDKKEKAS